MCDWSQMSGKMWAVMWSGDIVAVYWEKKGALAHVWTCGQFDLVFHTIGGEWELYLKHTVSFLGTAM